ncbi:unnamed protein product [Durusdinium trenchii]|uniref:Ion transport domain-containing protein n=1 Tax=Durusdinium trenchii TaxID=1381693 RepID=A0ABP0ICX7_9DINO
MSLVQGRQSFEEILTDQLDGLKSAVLAAHGSVLEDLQLRVQGGCCETPMIHELRETREQRVPRERLSVEEEEELLQRGPQELMILMDSAPGKFMEETLSPGPVDRWYDLYMHLRSKSRRPPVAEPSQLTILEPWTAKFSFKALQKGLSRPMFKRRPSLTLGDTMLDKRWLFRKITLTPHGNARLAWTFFGLLAICWDLIFIPLQMFDINAEVDNLINVVSVAIFVYWVLDVPATFITGFDRAGILEMRIHEIARNYAKGWLGLDVTVLVLDVMIFVVLSFNTESESGSNDSMGSFRLARALRLMRFLRLLRLHKMANLAAEILDRFKTDSFLLTMNILRSLAAVLALNHYMSCAFLGLALFAAEGELTWIEIAELQHMDFLTQYFSALHWSLTQFMPATNNIAPNTAPERIYAIFVVLIGLAVFSSFVSGVTNTVNQLRQIHTEHFKQESRMKSFLTQKSVSVDVWCRVQKFCRLRILLDKMSLKEGDIPMLQDLPHGLRVKLHAEIYMPILVSANWMPSDVTEIDEELMLKLCDKVLLEKVASPMQEIFLERGECPEVVIPTAVPRQSLIYWSSRLKDYVRVEEGTWLCELSLWARWEYRGQLDTEEVSHYVVIPTQEFALAVTKAGGSLFQLIRTIGLLYIAKAESQDANCDGIPLTDLPLLSESDAQDVTDRAKRFGQLRLSPRKASNASLGGLFGGGRVHICVSQSEGRN